MTDTAMRTAKPVLQKKMVLPLSATHVKQVVGVGRATWKGHLAGFLFLCHDSERMYTYRIDAIQNKESLMSDDLATLETQRSKLLEVFLALGHLRPGSLTAAPAPCAPPARHRPDHN